MISALRSKRISSSIKQDGSRDGESVDDLPEFAVGEISDSEDLYISTKLLFGQFFDEVDQRRVIKLAFT
jgi:hypothetical protein